MKTLRKINNLSIFTTATATPIYRRSVFNKYLIIIYYYFYFLCVEKLVGWVRMDSQKWEWVNNLTTIPNITNQTNLTYAKVIICVIYQRWQNGSVSIGLNGKIQIMSKNSILSIPHFFLFLFFAKMRKTNVTTLNYCMQYYELCEPDRHLNSLKQN